MEDMTLEDFLNILRRNVRLFALIAGVVFAFSFLVAASWSNYKAVATIEIAQPEVPDDVVSAAGASLRDKVQMQTEIRVGRLQQKVLSTGSLVEIITKFNLYANARTTTPIAALAEKMRKKVTINFLQASQSRGGAQDPIAFELAFTYQDPLLTQQVTNELASRFLDEDMKERRTQAAGISAFLDAQIKALEASLAEQEKQVASFRSENGDVRPELLGFNQQVALSTAMSLQSLENQITTNLATEGALRAQLAAMDPYSRVVGDNQVLTTPTTMLKGLKSEYASLSAKYGPSHPDVIKVGRQVDAMEQQMGTTSTLGLLQAKRDDIQAQLAAARKTYGAENPTIVSLENQVKNLDRQLAEERLKPAPSSVRADADNPAYLQILTQLKSTEGQRKALLAQKKALVEQQEKYQAAVTKNPEAEQKMASLSRDYDNALARYRELKAKKMTADMTQTIEDDHSGQRLVMLNPPELPLGTTPSRKVFLALGMLVSVFSGLAGAFGYQLLRGTVIGPSHLESLLGAAPLITLPHIATKDEGQKLGRRKMKLAGLAFLAVMAVAALFSRFIMPLDVLWAVVLQRLGLN